MCKTPGVRQLSESVSECVYVWMCVCVTFGVTRFLLDCVLLTFHAVKQGGHSISLGLCPTKLPVKRDIQLGQLDVPATIFKSP